MNTLMTAGIVILGMIGMYLIGRKSMTMKTPEFIARAETEAWEKLEELLETAASNKSDAKTIAAAQARMAARDQRVADFKAKVAGL